MAAVFISFASPEVEHARELSAFLQASKIQAIFLDRDERDGIQPGAEWQRELYREIRACEIMVVLWSKSYELSRWCFFERTLASTLGKRVLPVLLDDSPLDPYLAATSQAVGLDSSDRFQRVVDGLTRLAIGSRAAFPWDRRRPAYPGLLSFDVADARVFFGREPEVQAVVDVVSKVSRHERGGWIVLVGPSGCGKSSILRAGVLARLSLEAERWSVAAPIRAGELKAGKLDTLVPPAADDGSRTLVIALDQLEELFDEQNDSAAVHERLARLGAWSATERVICVGTLRADFHAHFQRLAGKLGLRFRSLPVQAFPLAAVQRVILGPAEVAALEVEPTLLANLLQDASVDSLPLLAFALREVYERGDRTSLTQGVYSNLGGLDGAAAKVADRVLASHGLDDIQRAQFLETLVRLVRVNDNDEPIRRALAKAEIAPELEPLFDDLVQNRLLVASDDESPFLELSHEALIRVWKPLCEVVESEREFLVWHRRFQVFASAGDGQQDLLHGHALSEAQGWLKLHPNRLTPSECELILRSTAADQAELNQKLQASEELARTKSASARYAWIGLAVALVLGVTAAWFAVTASRRRDIAEAANQSAQDKAGRLLAYKLIQASDDVLSTDRRLALLLALEAYDRENNVAIRRRIFAASEPDLRIGGHPTRIVAADWSSAGDVVATASMDGAIRIWRSDGQLDQVVTSDAPEPELISFSRTAAHLALLSKDRTVSIWPRGGGSSLALEPGREIKFMMWSPADDSLVVAAEDGLAVYDAAGRPIVPWTPLELVKSWVSLPGPYFSPDGARLATATRDGVHVLSLKPSIGSTTTALDIKPLFVRWQADGALLVGGDRGSAILSVDGRLRWRDARGISLGGFYVGGQAKEFLSLPPESEHLQSAPKRLTLRDTAGKELRKVTATEEHNCAVLDGTAYCEQSGGLNADGHLVDFGYRLSTISLKDGRLVVAGVSKRGELCLPQGRRCSPIAPIPGDWQVSAKEGELAFALGPERALLANEKNSSALILSHGTSTATDEGGDLVWLSDDGFLLRGTSHTANYAADGKLRARLDDSINSVAPSGLLMAMVTAVGSARQITFRKADATVQRRVDVMEGGAGLLRWGAQDRDFAYATATANFVVDPTSSDAPRQLPAGDLEWAPQGRTFALFTGSGTSTWTVTVHAAGQDPAVVLSSKVLERLACPDCGTRANGWSPGGRYFTVCHGPNGFAADVTQHGAPVSVPCELTWSPDDNWFTAQSSTDDKKVEFSVYSMPTGKLVRTFPVGATVLWSPGQARLAVLDQLELSFWTPENELKRAVRLTEADGKLKFSPSGELVWTRGTRGMIVGPAGSLKQFFFPGTVGEITWSPDGKLLAATSDDTSDAEPATSTSPAAASTTYVVSNHGELVAQLAGSSPKWSMTSRRLGVRVGSEERVWTLSEDGIADVRRRTSRQLTAEERARYGLPAAPPESATRP